MDKISLQSFITDSNKAGYATGQEKNWKKENDGSTTILYEKCDWKSHDNFFGGEPYGGRLVVSHKNKPVWIMVYYGWVEPGFKTDTVYEVLRKALKEMPEDAPFRGPKKLTEGEFTYSNSWDGDTERYSGEEQIIHGDKLIYKAYYRGGYVDQQAGV